MNEHDATATGLLDVLVDRGTWESWDTPVDTDPADDDYRASLIRARERTGTDESVLTGRGRIGGVDTVLVVSEFGFLGGSIGHDAGRRVVAAIEQATAGGLPVLALPASGGTRMQEGTAAFLQMVAITGAVIAHKAAGLPYLVYLRHPTTGGVFASWGSLGHITWAQPSALVGFLGPRVYEGLYGEPFPDGVQTAENLCRRGLVDRVLAPDDLAPTVARTLRLMTRGGPRLPVGATDHSGDGSAPTRAGFGSAWDAVVATRASNRPGLVEFLDEEETIRIREDGPIWLALSDFGGRTAVVIGQDRRRQAAGELIAPMDLRVARRGMALAADLALPVLTVIDTPGAELSVAAEEGGLATEIARCTADLIGLPVPTVSVLLGQGAGGAALALFPADRRVAATDGWLSPLPPEGASIIVYRNTEHAPQLADEQGITATALLADGTVDRLVDVTGPDGVADLRATVAQELARTPEPVPAQRTRTPDRRRTEARTVPVSGERSDSDVRTVPVPEERSGGDVRSVPVPEERRDGGVRTVPVPEERSDSEASRRVLGVGAIIWDDDDRLLLVKRGHPPQMGRWTVPGGKVEPRETLEAAVVRETLEETGLHIDVVARAWVVDVPGDDDVVFEVHDFVARVRSGTLQAGDDAADAGWFDVTRMGELELTDGLVDHLERHGLMR